MSDIVFDSSWCPVCARQILPKRYLVPIAPPPPPAPAPSAPAPPPSSPVSQPKAASNDPPTRITRTKNGTIRARTGGLVHGTGRVKPNGTLKRADKDSKKSTTAVTTPAAPVDPPKPATPIRHRTVIDQGPIPLYCSDECRLADLQSSFGSVHIDYRPDRHASPPLPPVPNNSSSDLSAPEESDSASSTSSKSPVELPTSDAYAALSRIYDLPRCPPPPPPPLLRTNTSSSNESVNDYNSGVMMAARRIQAALCPPPQPQRKRAVWSTPSAMLSTTYALGATSRQQKNANDVIPGWTDGSNAWRASVYSFVAPPNPDSPYAEQEAREAAERAYRGFVATPHRSRGVYSTVGESSSSATSESSYTTTAAPPPVRAHSEVDDLYAKFEASLSRRSESRASFAAQRALSTSPSGSVRSMPATCDGSRSASSLSSFPQHSRRREVPLLKPGAEGKLLVPNVTMRRTPSGVSSYADGFVGAPKMRRSPLSRQGSEVSVEEEDATLRPLSLPTTQPRPEVRSWSYSDVHTYPIMQLPPKKEKRMQTQVVDGKEVMIEVEVEVVPERKRLFLFPGKSAFPKPQRH